MHYLTKENEMNTIIQATQLGTHFAAENWSIEEVGQWLVDSGFDPEGVFARNVFKGYQTQVDCG
jgi:hypothetical protein